MPRQPSCVCGVCTKCKNREAFRRFYSRKTREERRAIIARRDPERVRAADRARYQTRKNDPEWIVKQKARSALGEAIRSGRVERQPCEKCGAPNAQGHHTDYSKPFDVRWLCSVHHAEEHV